MSILAGVLWIVGSLLWFFRCIEDIKEDEFRSALFYAFLAICWISIGIMDLHDGCENINDLETRIEMLENKKELR